MPTCVFAGCSFSPFDRSLWQSTPAAELLMARLPVTFQLGLWRRVETWLANPGVARRLQAGATGDDPVAGQYPLGFRR
jgi:hypothetical protein